MSGLEILLYVTVACITCYTTSRAIHSIKMNVRTELEEVNGPLLSRYAKLKLDQKALTNPLSAEKKRIFDEGVAYKKDAWEAGLGFTGRPFKIDHAPLDETLVETLYPHSFGKIYAITRDSVSWVKAKISSVNPKDPLEQFEVIPAGADTLPMFNNVAAILLASVVLMCILLASFNMNLRSSYDYIMRAVYGLVRSVVKENLSIKKQQYFSVLFYLFVTLLFANLIGLLPFSFTVTSSFVVTLYFSLTHFIGVNLIGVSRHLWGMFDLFLPSGAPLAIAPFLILIEAISYIARVLSLSIRLFANMMSGHALLKILIGFSWALLTSGSLMIVLAIFPWAIVTAVSFLELLIAFLQTYVFVILVTLYINDVLTFHD